MAVVAVLLFAIWVSAALNYQQGYSDGGDEAAEYEDDSSVNGVVLLEAVKGDKKAKRNEWRDKEDLEAQRDMAKWALLMFAASALGVVVTGAGFVYVAMTLKATRDTVQQMRNANAAAWKAVEVTETVGERQVQAYLSAPEGIYELWEYDRPRLYGCLRLSIKIKNFGQSPAHNVRIEGKFQLFEPVDINEDFFKSVRHYYAKGFCADVPPGGEDTAALLTDGLLDFFAQQDSSTQFYIDLNATLIWENEFGHEQRQPVYFASELLTTYGLFTAKGELIRSLEGKLHQMGRRDLGAQKA